MERLLLPLALVCFSALPAAAGLTLVKDGKPKAYVSLELNRGPATRHGAEELQRYIRDMSGATLPILDPMAKVAVVAQRGHTPIRVREDRKLAEEEFSIRSGKDGLVISGGGKRGAMYGCYALLEDVLGVRWYNSRVTKAPKRATVAIPDLNIRQKPSFEYREPFFTEAFDGDWAARNRTNGHHQRLTGELGGGLKYQPFVHTFDQLVPPGEYFAGHPEYFSEIDGKRVPNQQLCLTNPEVVRLAAARVKTWVRRHPEATIFSVSQNDCYGNCQCANCRAVEAEEGAPSGVLLRFVNAVAAEVGREYPGVLIDTLAYQWSEKPPAKVKPAKNVRVRIAPIYACFGHGMEHCDANKSALANLKAWHAITDQLYVWHYCTNFANYLQPLPCLDEIAADIPLFRANGVVGLFYEGGYAPGGLSEMAELKAWVMAKMMWDTSRPAQPLIDEYLRNVYGPAAPMVQRWLDLLHSGLRQNNAMEVHIFDPPTAPYLSELVLNQGERLFAEAARAASKDPVAADEVDRARLALEYVLLMRRGKDYVPAGADEPVGKTVASKLRRWGVGQVREGQPVEHFLSQMGL